MLLTLLAAGTTVLVGAILLAGPAVTACTGDARGLFACLRGMADERFDFGRNDTPAARPMPPVVAAAPAIEPVPEMQVVDVPPAALPAEPTGSLLPQAAEQPVTPEPAPAVPKPQVPAEPKAAAVEEPAAELAVAAAPGEAKEPAPQPVAEPEVKVTEPADPLAVEATPPPETIALAKLAEPTPAPDDAPSFPPSQPAAAVEGVLPDPPAALAESQLAPAVPDGPAAASELQAAVPEPAPAFTVPVVPEVAASAPPDLRAAAPDPPPVLAVPAVPDGPAAAPELPAAAPDPAPVWTVPVVPEVPASAPPDPQAAVPDPAPVLTVPAVPEVPAAPPPDLAVAAVDPVVPAEEPPSATPVLAPSIDAVEIEGDGSFIAGNGPAGATMRLYVDGLPAGVSPVEGGRWLVEGTDLLTEERQTLKVEALDPVSGRVLGEATIVFERPVEPLAGSPVAPGQAPAEPAVPPAVEAPSVPDETADPVGVEQPPAVPPIAPVVPSVESPSVTILKPAAKTSITTLSTGKPSEDAMLTLGTRPAAPAVVAAFTMPAPETTPDVTVLRAVPVGDAGAGRFVSGKAIIRRGDTLWDIAHRYYGRGVHYRTIFRANRELIARPGRIYPGQVLDLPLVYD